MNEPELHHTLVQVCFGAAVVTALATLFITAPYGRHARAGWGPTISGTVGWMAMEAVAVVTIAVCFFVGRRPHAATEVAFLAFWEIHYLHRAVVYPLRRAGAAKRVPILVPLLAIVFNLLNGYVNGRYLFSFGPVRSNDWFLDPRFLLGTVIFFAGLAINIQSDEILLHLRKTGEKGYVIPFGGLFRWVTSPNYLGEMLEWSGFALLTWSPAALAFAVYTASNLAPRAIAHHRWYRETFPEYPRERRALLPFLI
jgi:3-oxo-5-alpha-steroid 4-dehydrogenase 1